MVKVKICGITRQQDADVAVEAGVNALGFIFVESSPRHVNYEIARDIIRTLPPFVTPVGVFVNEQRQKIQTAIARTGIQTLQFHGDESPDDIMGYELPVYKAFRVNSGLDISTLSRYDSNAFLLDAFSPEMYGGTGKTIDWSIAREAKQYGRIILSGGVSVENVKEAIDTVAPYAIDVNSGVEVSPGIKDASRIQQLFAAMRTN